MRATFARPFKQSREAISALSDQVLEAAAVRIRDMLGADRATLYIYDAAKEELRSRIAHTDGSAPLGNLYRSIDNQQAGATWSFYAQQPLLGTAAINDPFHVPIQP